MPPTRVIIDTDPGLDDTAAILFTLACPERVTVELVTTVFGNTAIEHCTRNALTILEAAGRTDIPLYEGATRPLLRPPRFAPHIGLAHQVAWQRGLIDAEPMLRSLFDDLHPQLVAGSAES